MQQFFKCIKNFLDGQFIVAASLHDEGSWSLFFMLLNTAYLFYFANQFSYVFVDKCLVPAILRIIQLQRKCRRWGTTAMDNYACNSQGTCYLSMRLTKCFFSQSPNVTRCTIGMKPFVETKTIDVVLHKMAIHHSYVEDCHLLWASSIN